MRRNANLAVPWLFGGLLALAIVFLLTGCGRFSGRGFQTPSIPHSVTLSWIPSTSPVAGYNVYRASPPGGPAVKITGRPVGGNKFVDTNVEVGHTYSYVVTAVDSKGMESRPTVRIFVTLPAPVTWIQSLRNCLPSFPSFASLRYRFRSPRFLASLKNRLRSSPFVQSLRDRLRSFRRGIHWPHFG
jgi:hypothetical protein